MKALRPLIFSTKCRWRCLLSYIFTFYCICVVCMMGVKANQFQTDKKNNGGIRKKLLFIVSFRGKLWGKSLVHWFLFCNVVSLPYDEIKVISMCFVPIGKPISLSDIYSEIVTFIIDSNVKILVRWMLQWISNYRFYVWSLLLRLRWAMPGTMITSDLIWKVWRKGMEPKVKMP